MTVQATTPPARSIVSDYIALTKPRIISLLLVTAIGGMFLAAQGLPDAATVAVVLVGGYLAAGGAHALNHYLERDIDGMMRRTSRRPVVSGRVTPTNALVFGVALNVIAFVLLSSFVNVLSATITLTGTLIYIFVYTIGLKRVTPQNIVIGGAAGAVPPMVGWTAITGSLDLPALYLFAIIFFWTPPHFWALAILIKDDYVRAGIPMLPVVSSLENTKQSILLYTVLLTALTVMFFVTGAVGGIYLASTTVLGGLFIYFAYRFLRAQGVKGARSLYLYSLLYLDLLFLAIMIDSVV
ncbi:MAG: protoheme IX farnesyltransferase [SAR202 cluster bacterium]|nr:protoheme IX farnesyltransferase [SAR202 cluster bacterium]